MRKHIYTYPILMLLVMLAACKKPSSYNYPPGTGSAYDIITADVNFSTFKYAVDKAGLAGELSSSTAYTVFAPTNTAFTNAGYPLSLLQNMSVADVTTLVKYNIVSGVVDVNSVATTQTLTNLAGQPITILKKGGHLYADGGDITNPSQTTTGGLLNVVNKVLNKQKTLMDVITNYSNATTNSQFTFLIAAIAKANTGSTNITALLSGTDSYTFFAPNNGAFIDAGYLTVAAVTAADANTLGNILKYHLVAGTKLTTAFDSAAVASYNGTNIYFDQGYNTARTTLWFANGIQFGNNVPANMLAGNGVMHTVSRLLPTPVAQTTWDRINSDATLTMFAALVQRASTADAKTNFQSMLSGSTGPSYTVFAINNTGLIAAGYANVAAINAESPTVLANILKLHLIQKRVNSISVGDNGTRPTLLTVTDPTGAVSDAALTFTVTGGYKIKGASNPASITVVTGNVTTTNGILNIINGELLP